MIKNQEKQEKEENSKIDAQTHINNAMILSESKDNNEADIIKTKENEINHSEISSKVNIEIPKKIALNYNDITNEQKTWSVLTK